MSHVFVEVVCTTGGIKNAGLLMRPVEQSVMGGLVVGRLVNQTTNAAGRWIEDKTGNNVFVRVAVTGVQSFDQEIFNKALPTVGKSEPEIYQHNKKECAQYDEQLRAERKA